MNSPRSIPITITFGELHDLIFQMQGNQFECVTLDNILHVKVLRAIVEHPILDDIVHLNKDQLWRKDAWLVDVEHHAQERLRAERDRRLSNLRKEACTIIVNHMREISTFIELEDMELIAYKLLDKRDKGKLVKFGLDGDEWRELFE